MAPPAQVQVRVIYHGCDRILAQSRAFFAPIQALGLDAARILYYPNSAEALYRQVAATVEERRSAGLPPGFLVMFAGNIGVAQDFGTTAVTDCSFRAKNPRSANLQRFPWITVPGAAQRAQRLAPRDRR